MTQVEQQNTHDWTGRTVRGRDGAGLGRLTEVHGTWGVVRSRLGRRRLVPLDGAVADDDRGVRVPVDRAGVRSAPRAAATAPDPETAGTLHDHYHGRRVLADAQARRRERFGGMKLGAAFFGWLVAVGLTVLLAGIVGGVLTVLGTAPSPVVAALVALAILVVAYFAGGYVAGRLARFDGARNGLRPGFRGGRYTAVAAIAGATADARFALFTQQVQLPAVPLTAEQLTVAGIVTFVAIVVGTLVGAMLGGKAGERFHRKVDLVGERAG